MDIAALSGFAAVAALVVLATGGTVCLVKMRPSVEHDPDTKFWYAFAGLTILIPAILLTLARHRWAGAAMALLAAVTWWYTNKLVSKRMAARVGAAAQSELAARHNAVLERWLRYELDPAAAIDFPSMGDVRVPETSALVKAVALAESLRGQTSPDGTQSPEYSAAVGLLEQAFGQAEMAALAEPRS